MEWEDFLRKYSRLLEVVCSSDNLTEMERRVCNKLKINIVKTPEDPYFFRVIAKAILYGLERYPDRLVHLRGFLIDMVDDYIKVARKIFKPWFYEDLEKRLQEFKR